VYRSFVSNSSSDSSITSADEAAPPSAECSSFARSKASSISSALSVSAPAEGSAFVLTVTRPLSSKNLISKLLFVPGTSTCKVLCLPVSISFASLLILLTFCINFSRERVGSASSSIFVNMSGNIFLNCSFRFNSWDDSGYPAKIASIRVPSGISVRFSSASILSFVSSMASLGACLDGVWSFESSVLSSVTAVVSVSSPAVSSFVLSNISSKSGPSEEESSSASCSFFRSSGNKLSGFHSC